MKQLTVVLTFLLFGISLGVYAQDQESQENEIYFVNWLKPYNDRIMEFEKAIKNHNQKFHQEDPVMVFYDITGGLHGHYEIVSGPYSWTEYDNIESSNAHNNDWMNNLMPLVEHSAEPAAWKWLPNYQSNPLDSMPQKSFITLLTIKPGEYSRFMNMLDKWHRSNQSSDEFNGSYNVYARQMSGKNQVAILTSLENGWAELDEEYNFKQRLIDEYGESAWDLWIEDADMVIESEDIIARVARADLVPGSTTQTQ